MKPEFLGLLAQPDAAIIVAADPAEIVVAEPEQRAVVDHAAMLVAHGGIDHLAGGEFAHIAGERILQQRLGIGPGHLELAQRRQVHDGGPLAAGPVFVDRPVIGELLAANSRDTRCSCASSAEKRGWKAVSRVSWGSASGVMR